MFPARAHLIVSGETIGDCRLPICDWFQSTVPGIERALLARAVENYVRRINKHRQLSKSAIGNRQSKIIHG
jgi:hypothetical protein